MNILTNGTSFVHADVDRPGQRLTFCIPGQSGASPREWWGRLEHGDEVALGSGGPRVELFDETFHPIADDLSHGPRRLECSGVVYLRIHGTASVEIRVRRDASWFRTGSPRQGEGPVEGVFRSWLGRRLHLFEAGRRAS